MTDFFEGLKDLFEDIPAKTRFLKDLDFNSSYTGFRYFLQGHTKEPSEKFMEKICSELEYDYVRIPIKPGSDQDEIVAKLQSEFTTDVQKYLEKYEGDEARVYSNNRNGAGSVSEVVAAFEVDKDLLESDVRIDATGLFE